MQFTQELDVRSYVIRSYAPGQVMITEPITAETMEREPDKDVAMGTSLKRRTLIHSAVITPHILIDDWGVHDIDTLRTQDLDAILALKPEVLLLGTGATLRWPNDEVLRSLQTVGLGLEVMNSAAACRTYNILMLEGRRVAAALII